MRFYTSYKIEDFLSMTPQKVSYFYQAMKRIEARERLLVMDSNQYPHIDQKQRQKKHRSIWKEAYPESFKNKVLKTTDLELI